MNGLELVIGAVVVLVWGGIVEWRLREARKPKGALKLRRRMDALEAQVSGVPSSEWVNEVDGKLKVLEDRLEFSTPAKLGLVVERVNTITRAQETIDTRFTAIEQRFASLEQASKWAGIVKAPKGGE